jgi:endonuclease YncB( thermonuclease family)
MQTAIRRFSTIGVATIVGGFLAGSFARDKAGGSDDENGQPDAVQRATVKDEVRGGIAFRPEKRTWIRISGRVKVLAAHTLVYEDGSEVRLDGMMEAPELEQKGLIDGTFYPCGKDAAEFLRKLIGDRRVMCIVHRDHVDGKKMRGATAFVGETCLNIEMVRNGWAISDHEGMDGFEILARENKRGLWRGTFVVPGRWRTGDRLPGE